MSNRGRQDFDIPEVTNDVEATQLMEDWWAKSEQSVFYLVEKLNYVAKRSWDYLDRKEKEKFQKRFEWLSGYLRHYHLGEDCLHLIKEVPMEPEKDYRLMDTYDKEEDFE